jgi:hypothetical protein
VFRVVGIAKGFEVARVAERSAGIFGRSVPLPGNTSGIGDSFLRQENCLEKNMVPPVVPEIVVVLKFVSDPIDQRVQRHRALVDRFSPEVVVLRVRFRIETPSQHELVEMAVFPAEEALQDPMQRRQLDVFPNLNASPDWGIDVAQRDFQLVKRAFFHLFRHTNIGHEGTADPTALDRLRPRG